VGHNEVAVAVLDALGEPHKLAPGELGPRAQLSTRERRSENLPWGREHAVPWLRRRLRGESSGDTLSAKRPTMDPFA
jgi:hypothetical protein